MDKLPGAGGSEAPRRYCVWAFSCYSAQGPSAGSKRPCPNGIIVPEQPVLGPLVAI